MTQEKLTNVFRMVACIAAAEEYYAYCKQDLISLATDGVNQKIEQLKALSGVREKKHKLGVLAKHRDQIAKQYHDFGKKLRDFVEPFEKEPESLRMIEAMVDSLNELLTTMSLEITSDQTKQ